MLQYLPTLGWAPVSLTVASPDVDPNSSAICTPRLDPAAAYHELRSFLRARFGARRGISQGLPLGSPANRRRPSEYFMVPDNRLFWALNAVPAAIRTVRKNSVDAIYSSSPDASAHLTAMLTSLVTDTPWLAEFRDPWTRNPFRRPRPWGLVESVEEWLERLVTERAHSIVSVTEGIRKDFIERLGILPDRITTVPNGYDSNDFAAIEPIRFPTYTVVHVGHFYGARSALPFLAALKQFRTECPSLAETFRVVFVGSVDESAAQFIETACIADVISVRGPCRQSEALSYVMGADTLLLVPGPGDGTVTSKVFEYIYARKPILTIASRSAASSQLVLASGLGTVVAPEDTAGIVCALRTMRDGGDVPRADEPTLQGILARHERHSLASEVANALNAMTSPSPQPG